MKGVKNKWRSKEQRKREQIKREQNLGGRREIKSKVNRNKLRMAHPENKRQRNMQMNKEKTAYLELTVFSLLGYSWDCFNSGRNIHN